jgi:hypothetical protein
MTEWYDAHNDGDHDACIMGGEAEDEFGNHLDDCPFCVTCRYCGELIFSADVDDDGNLMSDTSANVWYNADEESMCLCGYDCMDDHPDGHDHTPADTAIVEWS